MALELFHPTLRTWFAERLGEPTPPQARAWPEIAAGQHVLVAAPTGSGKTLAAFLWALDGLLRQGEGLEPRTQVLYVSPLRALASDVRKNLLGPLAELRERDPSLPEVDVLVRSGDTSASERARMRRRAPHVLVTTPESLYLLLTSAGGRELLRDVRSVVVDEVHALLGDKRGSHLALSLERLDDLCGRDVQRIGLSATQKPVERVARFLGGVGREVVCVDEGHLRPCELTVEVPPVPLEPVCSHETWDEIHARVAQLADTARTTLVFTGTRKLAERVSAQLARRLGEERVACHHSSLSRERRLDAEERLKRGELRVLVATASLELGIDVGEVDLVVQLGSTRSIATLLQRVGRSGHGVGRTSRGVLFPLTPDELVEAAALALCVRRGVLDVTPVPRAPLDILAQQVVATCADGARGEDELLALTRRAWPYRELAAEDLTRVLELHAGGRGALLHRDPTTGRVRGTRGARLAAITSGGAIPDRADYRVVLEPGETTIGSVDEDFAVEASVGDVFQLGSTSWRVLKVESGTVRVVDAAGVPPSLPFWFGEAPARTLELSAAVAEVREHGRDADWTREHAGLGEDAAQQLAAYLRAGHDALGATPTQQRLVLERFFDESGGTQLVIHAPFGGRVNRALGLALRKRFCRRYGFELQAAANEDAVLLSLGPHHSFPLEEVLGYLTADTVETTLRQAVLASPLFGNRWRWNLQRSLALPRVRGGKRVPVPIQRMRAEDALAEAFPDAVACGENLPAGDLRIPEGHPLVDQTLADCLHEAMDVEGLERLLLALEDGQIEVLGLDTPEPSPFARGVLNVGPYGFLDDAPLEERRARAVVQRRARPAADREGLGALDPEAVRRVCAEAWPDPRDAEELHETLQWIGYLEDRELGAWRPWAEALRDAGRVQCETADGAPRWFAVGVDRDPLALLRGRMEALGPVRSDDPLMLALEGEGRVMRVTLDGEQHWCDRRLLARIQSATLEGLRRAIRPVGGHAFLAYLLERHGLVPGTRGEGPAGILRAVQLLAGWEAPAPAWERALLRDRVDGYRPTHLDELCLSGRVAWGRLWGSSRATLKAAPLALVPREQLPRWLSLCESPLDREQLTWPARRVAEVLEERGALFQADLESFSGLLATDAERGLDELVAAGLVTGDSFASLRQHLVAPSRRRQPLLGAGRWSAFRPGAPLEPPPEFVARVLLERYGIVFRALVRRERIPFHWGAVLRELRRMELAGGVRGGRFVGGFAGEQYALPEVVAPLRRLREAPVEGTLTRAANLSPADPLHGVAAILGREQAATFGGTLPSSRT